MKDWFTLMELAAAKLPDMPTSKRGLQMLAMREGWQAQPGKVRDAGQRGGGFEYHWSLLPASARAKLAFVETPSPEGGGSEARSKLLWQRFEALTKDQRRVCRERLDLLVAVETTMREEGLPQKKALERHLRETGVSRATYFEWRGMVEGVALQDRLAALAPLHGADGVLPTFAECHPDAWNALKSDYLRPEEPKFSACYRRMAAAAKKHGWSPIPHERSLRRRLEAEVPKAAQVIARKGKKRAAQLYPAQVRSKTHLHAMQITNTDGHQLDIFVRAPWSPTPVRVTLLGIQDVYSGKVLSWRLAESETWEVVGACIGDMVEDHGIPKHLYMDNGRAFASKKISGGAKRRNRFKIEEGEVAGLLKTLGIEPHFVKPYSGQSKPIERAWKDMAEDISKDPSLSGCYTGPNTNAKPENYHNSAVDLEVLRELVAEKIAEHNARPGRRSETAHGRSFDETFEESMRDPATIVARVTEGQRALWMLSAETVTARKPSGQLHYLGNIYWHPVLNEWIGKKLTIRFDANRLHDGVKVYDPAGRFLCDADCREKVGFDATHKARDHEKARKQLVKHTAAIAELHRVHTANQLAEIYGAGKGSPAKPAPVRPAITRIVTGNLAQAEPVNAMSDDEFEQSFARGLALMSGQGGDVIPFPSGNTPGRKPGKAGSGK